MKEQILIGRCPSCGGDIETEPADKNHVHVRSYHLKGCNQLPIILNT